MSEAYSQLVSQSAFGLARIVAELRETIAELNANYAELSAAYQELENRAVGYESERDEANRQLTIASAEIGRLRLEIDQLLTLVGADVLTEARLRTERDDLATKLAAANAELHELRIMAGTAEPPTNMAEQMLAMKAGGAVEGFAALREIVGDSFDDVEDLESNLT